MKSTFAFQQSALTGFCYLHLFYLPLKFSVLLSQKCAVQSVAVDTRLKCDLYTKSLDTLKRPKETPSLEMSYSSPGDCECLLHGRVVRRSEAIGGMWSRWSIAIYMLY